MDDVRQVDVLVLGDRNYPIAPPIHLSPVYAGPLSKLYAAAVERTPDLEWADLIKAVWLQGLTAVAGVLEQGRRVDAGGRIVATMVQPPTQPPVHLEPGEPPASSDGARVVLAAKREPLTGTAAAEFLRANTSGHDG